MNSHRQSRWISLDLAVTYHTHQHRDTGEPYITHPFAAFHLLWDIGVRDDDLLAAILLHDVVEDCGAKLDLMADAYGLTKSTLVLVDALTHKPTQSLEAYYAGIRNLPGAILGKLADRNHNLATIQGFTRRRARRYLTETKQFVLPLADAKQAKGTDYKERITHLARQIQEQIHTELRRHHPIKSRIATLRSTVLPRLSFLSRRTPQSRTVRQSPPPGSTPHW